MNSTNDKASAIHPSNGVLRVDGLRHVLSDPGRTDQFEVTLDQPLTINQGDFVAILGPSGCGKTTLLTILGLLRKPDHVDEFLIHHRTAESDLITHDVAQLWKTSSQNQIEALRRECIGFALQSGELISSLTVRENIAMPLRLNGFTPNDANQRVDHLIDAFDLEAEAEGSGDSDDDPSTGFSLRDSRVNKLSGGQYQRVVLARAIAHKPRIAFVDEPTSALNRKLAEKSLGQLQQSLATGEMPGAVAMITHDERLAREFANMTVRMEPADGGSAGRVVEISRNKVGSTA